MILYPISRYFCGLFWFSYFRLGFRKLFNKCLSTLSAKLNQLLCVVSTDKLSLILIAEILQISLPQL